MFKALSPMLALLFGCAAAVEPAPDQTRLSVVSPELVDPLVAAVERWERATGLELFEVTSEPGGIPVAYSETGCELLDRALGCVRRDPDTLEVEAIDVLPGMGRAGTETLLAHELCHVLLRGTLTVDGAHAMKDSVCAVDGLVVTHEALAAVCAANPCTVFEPEGPRELPRALNPDAARHALQRLR